MDLFKEFNFKYQTYKFYKPFIWGFVILCVGLGYYSLSLNNFTGEPYYYSSCPANPTNDTLSVKCFNMFYNSNLCGNALPSDSALCSQEFIYAGQSLGTTPPFVVQNFYLIILALAFILIISNHFIFNKGFKFPELKV